MSSYLTPSAKATNKTPQSQPLPGSSQVENHAGGYGWTPDMKTRLVRFLILGAQGDSYYQAESDRIAESTKLVQDVLRADFQQAFDIIVDVSLNGRSAKQDETLFAFAVACSLGIRDDEDHYQDERTMALSYIPALCRTGTHLFMFLEFVTSMRGWGLGLRSNVARWYTEKDPKDLAYQLIKYRQRNGWTHRDVLRQAHPYAGDSDLSLLLNWATNKKLSSGAQGHRLPNIIKAFEDVQNPDCENEDIAILTAEHRLPREALPTDALKDPQIWTALLPSMPIIALVRNLATMTRNGSIAPATRKKVKGASSNNLPLVLEKLNDEYAIRKSRIHPIQALSAYITYKSGRSARGESTWEPINEVVDALERLFYTSFGNVQPTGKRHLIALDVSGSMAYSAVSGIQGLSPRVASVVMAMVAARVGDPYEIVAFTGTPHRRYGWGYGAGYNPKVTLDDSGISLLPITARDTLQSAMDTVDNLPFGPTDCALPMIWAEAAEREYDLISIYTDSETWAGHVHPTQALSAYRKATQNDVKLAVIAMVNNDMSIASPGDPNQLDLSGFDTATPNILAEFASGNI